jgi:DNA repair exonuclease SbcCD ATPase subunit
MKQKASDHVKPCNIGQSEAHNNRTPEYLANIKKEKFYIRQDLTVNNESWISPQLDGRTLQQYYDDIAIMVKEKTGRAMQTKERIRKDPKTGKEKKINGSSPIRESVPRCKADTTMSDLKRYTDECHKRWGITAIQIYLHKDEGHYENASEQTGWKPNYHAHIVWDWMNHDTGKSIKMNNEDMQVLQDIVAESLDMERGTSKRETQAEHLERNDFILAKQKKELEQTTQQKAKAELQRDEAISAAEKAEEESVKLDAINQEKQKLSEQLDEQHRQKKEAIDKENGSAFKRGLAKLGFSKDELVTENGGLKERIAELERELKKAEDFKATVNHDFNNQVMQRVEKRTQEQTEQIASLKAQIDELKQEKDAMSKSLATEKANAKKEIASLNKNIEAKDATIEKQAKQIDQLDRKANPQRYRLSSGAELTRCFVPRMSSCMVHIWTKVGDVEYDVSKSDLPYDLMESLFNEEITEHEFVNELFEPWEQVNEAQAKLLGAAFELATGGPAQAHIGTGGGGSQSELPWRDKERNNHPNKRH